MDEWIEFGLYQFCENRGSVGRVSVLGGPGICVLCLADTCPSEVHPVCNSVAPYGYLLSDMYLFIVDIANPDSFV